MDIFRVTHNGVCTYYDTEYDASLYTLSLCAFGSHGLVTLEALSVPSNEYLEVLDEVLPYCIEWLN